jgi:hypothetical protein
MSTMDIEFSYANDLLTAGDVVNQQQQLHQQPKQIPAPTTVPEVQTPAAAAAPPVPKAATTAPQAQATNVTNDVDYSFLDKLSNKRKTKTSRVQASNTLGPHENLDLYDEDSPLAKAANQERLERIQTLRKNAEREASRQSRHRPKSLKVRPAAASASRNDIDDATFASIMGGKSKSSSSRRAAMSVVSNSTTSSSSSAADYHRRRRAAGGGTFSSLRPPPPRPQDDNDDFGSSVSDGGGDDDMSDYDDRPRKSAAELLLEEMRHKATRVARIEQLESKGIKCSLPDDVSWMSLPLTEIDEALMLMETMYKRKGRILKMRAGFYGLNKALVWGATNHPGPEFLKFYKVRGFDKTIASEIDEFDDDLEKLYEMWFGEGGDMHPLMSILLIEATMLGNHVMAQGEKPEEGISTKVREPGANAKEGSSGAASQTNLLTNMMSMLSKNPAMSGAVQSVMGAAAATPEGQKQQQQQQQQQALPPYVVQQQSQSLPNVPPNIFQVRDYGSPPAPEVTREFQMRDQQIRQLEDRVRQQTVENERLKKQQQQSHQSPASAAVRTLPDEDTEELRLLMDNLMERHSDGGESGGGSSSRKLLPPAEKMSSISVEAPLRGGRGGGRGRGGSRGVGSKL